MWNTLLSFPLVHFIYIFSLVHITAYANTSPSRILEVIPLEIIACLERIVLSQYALSTSLQNDGISPSPSAHLSCARQRSSDQRLKCLCSNHRAHRLSLGESAVICAYSHSNYSLERDADKFQALYDICRNSFSHNAISHKTIQSIPSPIPNPTTSSIPYAVVSPTLDPSTIEEAKDRASAKLDMSQPYTAETIHLPAYTTTVYFDVNPSLTTTHMTALDITETNLPYLSPYTRTSSSHPSRQNFASPSSSAPPSAPSMTRSPGRNILLALSLSTASTSIFLMSIVMALAYRYHRRKYKTQHECDQNIHPSYREMCPSTLHSKFNTNDPETVPISPKMNSSNHSPAFPSPSPSPPPLPMKDPVHSFNLNAYTTFPLPTSSPDENLRSRQDAVKLSTVSYNQRSTSLVLTTPPKLPPPTHPKRSIRRVPRSISSPPSPINYLNNPY